MAVVLNRFVSPNHTSNCVDEDVWFVFTNGIRPWAADFPPMVGGVNDVGQVAPPSSDSQMLMPASAGAGGRWVVAASST